MKVYFLQGLPASGKSTLSAKIIKDNPGVVRVNKDMLREMLSTKDNSLDAIFSTDLLTKMMFCNIYKTGEQFKLAQELFNHLNNIYSTSSLNGRLQAARKAKSFGPKEKIIIDIQTNIINFFVSKSLNFIVDDTNYNSIHLSRIKSLTNGYQFEFIDMHKDPYNVTLEQCIERNEKRIAKVPKVAIYGMAKQYGVFNKTNGPAPEPYITNNDVVVCDIDGTLADISHRIHFIRDKNDPNKKKEWKPFFDAMDKDAVREEIKSLLLDSYVGYDKIIVTGRPDSHREITEQWLKNNGITYNAIYMRNSNDRRSDVIVKQEILDKYLPKDKIKAVIDDRPAVVAMWRQNKLIVIDVGDPALGDF